MNYREYVEDREARDPAFRAARNARRPQYEFRRALIEARLRQSLSQAELARKLGTTQSAIARLESGAIVPTVETLCRLSESLGIVVEIQPEQGLVIRAVSSPLPEEEGKLSASPRWEKPAAAG